MYWKSRKIFFINLSFFRHQGNPCYLFEVVLSFNNTGLLHPESEHLVTSECNIIGLDKQNFCA